MRSALAAAALLVLAACGTETGEDPDTAADPSGTPTPTDAGPMPTSVAPPDGQVTARATVLDKDGPELCLGGVLESLPPQCGGPPIVGWDWSEFDAGEEFDSAGGVRWGVFVVWGTFDGATFTLDRAVPESEVEPDVAPDDSDRFRTRCDEPAGGWQVVDPDKVDTAANDAVFAAARELDGYAGAFIDTSPDPRTGEQMDSDAAEGNDDQSLWIVNVAVTGDVAVAEAALREHWGGALCVFVAQHTEVELRGIQQDLGALPGILGSGGGIDSVEVSVVWDDGSLQEWADATYGEGVVTVYSALRPA